jgi:hypothetical protein
MLPLLTCAAGYIKVRGVVEAGVAGVGGSGTDCTVSGAAGCCDRGKPQLNFTVPECPNLYESVWSVQ